MSVVPIKGLFFFRYQTDFAMVSVSAPDVTRPFFRLFPLTFHSLYSLWHWPGLFFIFYFFYNLLPPSLIYPLSDSISHRLPFQPLFILQASDCLQWCPTVHTQTLFSLSGIVLTSTVICFCFFVFLTAYGTFFILFC